MRPNVGQGPLLVAFVGVVIGGPGSLAGAALGGFVLGLLINIFSATLPRSIQGHTLMFAFLLVIASTVAALHGNVDGWLHPLYGYPEHRNGYQEYFYSKLYNGL